MTAWREGIGAVQRVRDDVVEREKALRSADVGLRVLSVPEAAFRKALGSGALRLPDSVSPFSTDSSEEPASESGVETFAGSIGLAEVLLIWG